MDKEPVADAEKLELSELRKMVTAAENHDLPIVPAKGPCGGCDLVIPPQEVAEGPCGGCDLVTEPRVQAEGPCGGCDLLVKK